MQIGQRLQRAGVSVTPERPFAVASFWTCWYV